MSLADFNVAADDVLDRSPMKSSTVGANTDPISTGDIDDLIQDAESKLAAQFEKAGIDPASLTDDQGRQAQNFVEVWCVAEIMEIMGATGRRFQQYRDKANELLAYFDRDANRWADHGASTVSNIDSSTDHTAEDFTDAQYQF